MAASLNDIYKVSLSAIYRHKKTGRLYKTVDFATNATNGMENEGFWLVYESLNDEDYGRKYIRRLSEFCDGRFEERT